ncbi:MAG: zinc-binding dehydrogenase [Sphaerochaeta sp.]|jgi:S-(hydroxymethyl)glutathione dehydrogenase/alcohol dehydrogenase|nr:zinc-binding dehydrogenase [Sphaerochaeta sp.]
MKAAILESQNAPLVIDELDVPALGQGQVLVQIRAAGICGAQLNEISGVKGPDKYLPHCLGHEGAGKVEEIGPGVTCVNPGDHVVIHWRKGAGIESAPPKYTRTGGRGIVGGGWNTTFQELSVVSENRLTVIPGNIPDDIAALMGCAVTTGLGVVFNDLRLRPGQSIAVIGCGGVGLNVVQGARIAGAGEIFAFDIHAEKLYMASYLGANRSFGIDALSEAAGCNAIVDTTGRPELIAAAYSLVAPGGTVVMVGQPRRGDSLVLPDVAANFKGKTLLDSTGGSTDPNRDIPAYLDLYGAGLLKLRELITHRFPLAQVNEALDAVRSGLAGRVILEM